MITRPQHVTSAIITEPFDKIEIYQKEIKSILKKVIPLLKAHNLPYLFSFCPKADNKHLTLDCFYQTYSHRFSKVLNRAASVLLQDNPSITPDTNNIIEFDYEPYYDQRISPMLNTIYDICQIHEIPILFNVIYGYQQQKGFSNARSMLYFPHRHVNDLIAAAVQLKRASTPI